MAVLDLRGDVQSKKNKINKGRVGNDMIGGDRGNLIKTALFDASLLMSEIIAFKPISILKSDFAT